jgi:hypothetical protein
MQPGFVRLGSWTLIFKVPMIFHVAIRTSGDEQETEIPR